VNQPHSDSVRASPTEVEAIPRRARSLDASARVDRPFTGEPVSILCVDDHAVLVDGLAACFAADGRLRLTGSLASADDLNATVAKLLPDIVLLDVELPGIDAFEAADRLRHADPGRRFAFLSGHVRSGSLAAAAACGAWGYFAKVDPPASLVAGLLDIARAKPGAFVAGPSVRDVCLAAGSRHPLPGDGDRPQTRLELLTVRELEVLRLIGKGRSRGEIASELARSPKTVDGHQERMMKKLGITSRNELMRFSIREGLAEA